MLIYGRPLPTTEIVARIEAVDAAQVAAAARRLFAGDPTLAAIGPIEKLESMAQLRARLA